MDSVATTPSENCPNCGAGLLGSHCHECGQKKIQENLVFALRRVYQQKWPMTLLKAVILFACETLLFFAVNIGGFIIAYSFV